MLKTVQMLGAIVLAVMLSVCPASVQADAEWDGNSPIYYVSISNNAASGVLLGEIKDHKITGFDPMDIYVNGERLSDDVRYDLPYDEYGCPLYTTASKYAEIGKIYQLYSITDGLESGRCEAVSAQYFFYAASGSDVLQAEFTIPDEEYYFECLTISGTVDTRPRGVTERFDEGGGGYYIIHADIEGDGIEETIRWAMSANYDAERLEHPIYVLRNSEIISEVTFWYDFDYSNPDEYAYTIPEDPSLLDINGDGVYELILRANGHNSYIRIYAWENDAFIDTGARYYSGD